MGDLRRLIAFDLDGTLIDSRRDLADSANQLIVEYGGQPLPEETVGRMVGEGARLLVQRALAAARIGDRSGALDRFLAIYDERLLNHTRVYDGLLDVLRAARAHAALAVLTNKPLHPSERLLAALGLRGFFDDVIGGDGPFPKKPDPASLLSLTKRAGAARETTLLVGDSPIDYETAARAGVRCCLVAYGFGFARFPAGQRAPAAWIADTTAELGERIGTFCA